MGSSAWAPARDSVECGGLFEAEALVQLRSPLSAYGLTPICVAAGYFVFDCASGRRDGVATLFERPRLLCRTGQRSVLQAEGTRACGTPKRKGSGAGTPGRPGVFFRGEEDWLRGLITVLICYSSLGLLRWSDRTADVAGGRRQYALMCVMVVTTVIDAVS